MSRLLALVSSSKVQRGNSHCWSALAVTTWTSGLVARLERGLSGSHGWCFSNRGPCFQAVIPRPFAPPLRTVLSAAKELRVNCARDLALKSQNKRDEARFLTAFGMTRLRELFSVTASRQHLKIHVAGQRAARGHHLDRPQWWRRSDGCPISWKKSHGLIATFQRHTSRHGPHYHLRLRWTRQ
jgi:hypothetical protein